jgi:hypothetical protein
MFVCLSLADGGLLLGSGGVFLGVRSEGLLPREHLSLINNQIQNTWGSFSGG